MPITTSEQTIEANASVTPFAGLDAPRRRDPEAPVMRRLRSAEGGATVGTAHVVAGGLDFADWYQHEHRKVFGSMVALCGDPELAADVTADAFAKALASWSRVGVMERPGGWVYQVALNRLRRRLGRSKKERGLLEAHALDPGRSAVTSGPDDTRFDLWEAVRGLPERQRHAVVLRYVADLSEPEIATILGVARGTIASNLADARRTLSAALEPGGGPGTMEPASRPRRGGRR